MNLLKEHILSRICDYEGSKYRTEFWESQNRAYEDAVERVALKKLLPPAGQRIIEVGAGFGRLVDLYDGYQQIVLVDYARTQLEEAQKYLGVDNRLLFVVSDIYNLPFANNLFNTLTMIRVMHHLTDVPAALREIHRVVLSGGTTVIEHANKLHAKALLRWLLRRQTWNPFDHAPYEFVELNFNFHPAWMRQQFESAGLRIQNIRSVSSYRIDFLKRAAPTSLLVTLDAWTQSTGNWWQLSPSLFLQATAQKPDTSVAKAFFRCPKCKNVLSGLTTELQADQVFKCQTCGLGWGYKNGIYDFKTPVGL